ncbi:MAG: hypothetical protein ABIY70_28125 [Capsulimonas sp.]|uniref:hypothetical protein n=1 Tax=Capsulimonas sp. TaxID=2494211 RepID=UPI003262FA1F
MNPIKIFGGVLVALGCIFRAISLAYFNLLEKRLPPGDLKARRRFEGKKRRALIIDAGFVLFGFYTILSH